MTIYWPRWNHYHKGKLIKPVFWIDCLHSRGAVSVWAWLRLMAPFLQGDARLLFEHRQATNHCINLHYSAVRGKTLYLHMQLSTETDLTMSLSSLIWKGFIFLQRFLCLIKPCELQWKFKNTLQLKAFLLLKGKITVFLALIRQTMVTQQHSVWYSKLKHNELSLTPDRNKPCSVKNNLKERQKYDHMLALWSIFNFHEVVKA